MIFGLLMRISFKIWYCKSFYRLKKEKAKRNSIESTDELPARVLVWKVMDWIFILFYLLTWKIMPKRVSKPFWPKDSPLIKWAIVKFGHQKGGFFYFVFSQSYVLASYDIVWRHCWPSLLFVVIIKLNILVLFFFWVNSRTSLSLINFYYYSPV